MDSLFNSLAAIDKTIICLIIIGITLVIGFAYTIIVSIKMSATRSFFITSILTPMIVASVISMVSIFLDNSVKYTGGSSKSSYFVVSENKGKIEFKFSNTIDKDDKVDVKHMMERFYRSPSNKKEGSGIGLSVAQEIINLHKGKISIDKSNSTITFIISF